MDAVASALKNMVDAADVGSICAVAISSSAVTPKLIHDQRRVRGGVVIVRKSKWFLTMVDRLVSWQH